MGFFIALKFLTIFPAPAAAGEESPEKIGSSVAYFPVVGSIIGILLAALYYLIRPVFPPVIVSALLVTVLAILTGAHHLDGLIDTCDAMVAGRTREQRLAIMSDTQVGTFGLIGAVLLLLIKFAALMEISRTPALILFPLLSRWAMIGSILLFPPARESGLGFAVKSGTKLSGFLVATVFTLIIAALLSGLISGPILMAVLFALVSLIGLFFRRLFGGLTGDCYGALVEMGEVLTLLLILVLNYFGVYSLEHNLIRLPVAG